MRPQPLICVHDVEASSRWYQRLLVVEVRMAAPPLINKRTMKIPITGGCACGAIRYECTAEPVAMFCCHCRDCQRASGGAGNYVMIMPAESFKFTRGAPRYHFTASAAIGHHKRGFCAECGSRLTGGENREGSSESSESTPVAWMTRVGFVRSSTFLPRMRSRGIKWTRRFQNTTNMRRDVEP